MAKAIVALATVLAASVDVASAGSAAGFLTNDYVEKFHVKMWQDFKGAFKKEFDGAGTVGSEDHMRMHVFKENLMRVEGLIKKNKESVFGFTAFTDMTDDEFAALRLAKSFAPSPDVPAATTDDLNLYNKDASTAPIPAELDRRRDMAVSHMKHQGSYPATVAFAVTGAIEGALAGPGKEVLRPVSEQWVLSCAAAKCEFGGEQACSPRAVLAEVVRAAQPIPAEESYEYGSGDGERPACRDTEGMTQVARVTDVLALPTDNDTFLKQWIQHRGPFLATVAGAAEWKLYQEGLFESTCGESAVEGPLVTVTVIGWGVEAGVEFWILKNSWGAAWGIHGTVKVPIGKKCLVEPTAVTVTVPKKASTEGEL